MYVDQFDDRGGNLVGEDTSRSCEEREGEGVEGEEVDRKKADWEEEEEEEAEEGWWVGEMAKTLEEEAQERNITDLFDPDLLGKNFHQHRGKQRGSKRGICKNSFPFFENPEVYTYIHS